MSANVLETSYSVQDREGQTRDSVPATVSQKGFFSRFPKARVAALAWACIILLQLSVSSDYCRADEQAELDKLLKRLSLSELQIIHLEDRLQQQTDRGRVAALAKQLSDAYIEVLLKSADNDEKFEDYTARIRRLKNKHAEVDSPSLEVMLLQAEYLRAEKLVMLWIENQSQADALKQAKAILDPIVPKFQSAREALINKISDLSDELGLDGSPALDDVREKQIDQLTQVNFRATYFTGWSNYYLAISLGGDETTGENFSAARDCFAEIVGVETDLAYTDQLKPDWIQLNSIWVARSLMGLGMSEIGLRNNDNGRLCFELLGHPNTAASLRTQSGYWHLQALLNIRAYESAGPIAKELLSAKSPLNENQKAGICTSLVRASFSSPKPGSQLKSLGAEGLNGLMRLRRFPQLISILDELKVTVEPTDFHSAWLSGYQKFLKAEKTKNKTGYQAAAKALQAALKLPEASQDVMSLAICRYHLAWAMFRLERMEDTEGLIAKAVPTLKRVDPELAVQAAWLRFESLSSLAKTDSRSNAQAIRQLQEIVAEYPGTQFARNAEYQLARLKRKSSTPEEVARDLEAITRDNLNYLSARYEVCLVYHQQWQASLADASAAESIKSKVLRSVDLFLRESRGERFPQRLRVALIAIDVSLRSKPAQPDRAKRYLEMAEVAQSRVSSGSTSVIEYHYQKFQLARLTGDIETVNVEAAWLTDNGSGTAYQKSAVIQLARAIDQRIADSTGEQRLEHIREAVRVYQQMSRLFGTEPENLKRDKNARVALSRLAGFQSELQRYGDAAENLEKLVAVFPSDLGYLRKCGTAQFHTGNYQRSLEHWRKLSRGLKNGSDEWYEAKYFLLYSLAKTDTAAARAVLSQFDTLHPDLAEPWAAKFDEVRKLLGK